MAGVVKRKNTWFATWTGLDGRTVMKTILYRFPRPYGDFAAVSFYTGGLRLGDVCMLRRADVDFEKEGIFVKEQKTKKPRFIHLIPVLRERLLARKAEQAEGEEYVFPETARKYQYSPGTVSTAFTALLKAFGIRTREEDKTALADRRRQITTKCFHSIRHTTVCLGRSNPNLSPDVVRQTVGHDSDAIEVRHYFTASDKAQREVSEALANEVKPDVA